MAYINLNPKTGRSYSASAGQPEATKPLFKFDDYTTARGERALSVRLDIRDKAKYYAEHPKQAGGYSGSWDSLDWKERNPYFADRITNADAALKAMAGFDFPAEIKTSARRAARRLTDVFMQVARLHTVRDLTAGRLDRRKFKAIARHTAAGTYDANTVRPYKRTVATPSESPTIAIVGSAGNAEMWDDATYIPRALTLTLSVLWACEAAGLKTYAALTKGHSALSAGQPYRESILGIMLAEPGATVSPRVYGAALHRDLWRYGFMTAQAADYAGNKRMRALAGRGAGASSIGRGFPSYHGGRAVRWAREVFSADIVIAIGNITDARDADIKLGSRFTVEKAVMEVVKQARKLDRAA
jgi:hypothetical protein